MIEYCVYAIETKYLCYLINTINIAIECVLFLKSNSFDCNDLKEKCNKLYDVLHTSERTPHCLGCA